MAPSSMHCAPPSKRHALCKANGHGWVPAVPMRCELAAPLPPILNQTICHLCGAPQRAPAPISNSPVTNCRANTSFLDIPRAHTRIRISTPHVGVLITFIGACAPPFRHRKRTTTKQRLSAVRGCKLLRGSGVATSGTTPNSTPPQPQRLGSKPRPNAAGAHRSAN